MPEKYWNLKLPHKLPPRKELLTVTALPMLGYMEQTVATAITKSLTAVGSFKPKYPFLSPSKSALIYVAYHLKGEALFTFQKEKKIKLVKVIMTNIFREAFIIMVRT